MKRIVFLVTICLTALLACTSEEAPKKVDSFISKVVLPQPFRFHKAIEVTPGLTFDVLSWGRGAEHIGQYLILRSDSMDVKYSTIAEELEGDITEAWNMDLDSDGHPEIFVQSKGADKDTYLRMYVYEFTEGGSSQQLKFPELTSATKKKYRGQDSVYTKDGNLFREFPLFSDEDTAGINPIDKKVLEYKLKSNRFDIKEIEDGK